MIFFIEVLMILEFLLWILVILECLTYILIPSMGFLILMDFNLAPMLQSVRCE